MTIHCDVAVCQMNEIFACSHVAARTSCVLQTSEIDIFWHGKLQKCPGALWTQDFGLARQEWQDIQLKYCDRTIDCHIGKYLIAFFIHSRMLARVIFNCHRLSLPNISLWNFVQVHFCPFTSAVFATPWAPRTQDVIMDTYFPDQIAGQLCDHFLTMQSTTWKMWSNIETCECSCSHCTTATFALMLFGKWKPQRRFQRYNHKACLSRDVLLNFRTVQSESLV